MLKVSHVVEDFSAANAGVTAAVQHLTALLSARRVQTTVVSPDDHDGFGRRWRYDRAIGDLVAREVERGAVIHVHGVWMHTQWRAAKECGAKGTPFILSPHNMLGGWLWKRGLLRRVKKEVYWRAVGYPVFRHVSAVHALTEHERQVLQQGFFKTQRIEVIPNAIDVTEADRKAMGSSVEDQRPFFLFLGRLHPVKGLDLLLEAFAALDTAFELWIVGPLTNSTYERTLVDKAKRCGRKNRVRFVGRVHAHDKWMVLRKAWCLCAPSFSEGLSMSALEALASSTPVISTPAAGLADLEEGGGVVCEPSVDAIRQALIQAAAWSIAERKLRGQRARALALRSYAPDVVAPRYVSLYESLL
jgi:glycosyltransferase involved in cell wall biosynthesis